MVETGNFFKCINYDRLCGFCIRPYFKCKYFLKEERIMASKICTKCKKEFPLDPEYFYRCKNTKDGFNHWCKTCHAKSSLKNKKPGKKRTLEKQAKSEVGATKSIKDMQAKSAALKEGDSLIKIESTGLEPALEMIMWQVLEKVKLKVTAEEAGKVKTNGKSVLTIDFSGHEEILDFVKKHADEDMRSVEKQVLWWLKNIAMLNGAEVFKIDVVNADSFNSMVQGKL